MEELSFAGRAYHDARDAHADNDGHRTFEQVLAEHSLAMIDLAIAHAHDNKTKIMSCTEKLTDLHGEWQGKTVSGSDGKDWKLAARKAVREFPHNFMRLTAAVFPGRGEQQLTQKQCWGFVDKIAGGLESGLKFHAGLNSLGGNAYKQLKSQYRGYGRQCVKMLAAVKQQGISSDAFYRAAAHAMGYARNLGKILDDHS